jgi:hypothetical protein
MSTVDRAEIYYNFNFSRNLDAGTDELTESIRVASSSAGGRLTPPAGSIHPSH